MVYMTENFGEAFKTFQQDCVDVVNFLTKGVNQNQNQNPDQRIQQIRENVLTALAGARLASTAFMSIGALYAISVVPYLLSAPVSSVISVAIAVLVLAISHDCFAMAKRKTDEILHPVLVGEANFVEGILREGLNIARGLMQEGENYLNNPRAPIGNGFYSVNTDGTCFPIIWTNILRAVNNNFPQA